MLSTPKAGAALETDTNRWGGDFYDFVPSTADAALCEKACREGFPASGYPYAKERCKAFTYVKPSSASPNGKCWLKETIPLPVTSTCCVSGVVRQDVCVHGSSGQVQTENANAEPLGSGLEYTLKGTGSWLHYAVATEERDSVIEGVTLRFSVSDPKVGWIAAIHVYDGNKRIWQVDDQSYGRDTNAQKPELFHITMPLTKPIQVRHGIGISLLPQTDTTGGSAKSATVEIHSVCAVVSLVR